MLGGVVFMGRHFSKELKEKVLQELATGKPVAVVCKEYEVNSDLIYRWRKEKGINPGLAFAGKGNPAKMETKIAQLEQKIGQQTMEIDFFNRMNKAMFEKLKEIKKNERREL